MSSPYHPSDELASTAPQRYRTLLPNNAIANYPEPGSMANITERTSLNARSLRREPQPPHSVIPNHAFRAPLYQAPYPRSLRAGYNFSTIPRTFSTPHHHLTKSNTFESTRNMDVERYDIARNRVERPYGSPYRIPKENLASQRRGQDEPLVFRSPLQFSKERFSPMRLLENENSIIIPRMPASSPAHGHSTYPLDEQYERLDGTIGLSKGSRAQKTLGRSKRRFSPVYLEESEDNAFYSAITASRSGHPRPFDHHDTQSKRMDEITSTDEFGFQGSRGGKKHHRGHATKIEELIERRVSEALASRAMEQPVPAVPNDISEAVQRRLEALERKIEKVEAEKAAHSAGSGLVESNLTRGASNPAPATMEARMQEMRAEIEAQRREIETEARDPGLRKGFKRRRVSD